jgi:hypothetical protein
VPESQTVIPILQRLSTRSCVWLRVFHRQNTQSAPVETQSPEWQAAAEALLTAAEDRGPLMLAHVGMMLALQVPSREGHGNRRVPDSAGRLVPLNGIGRRRGRLSQV